MKILTTILLLTTLLITAGCGMSIYDYGNGTINLKQVRQIRSEVVLVIHQDGYEDWQILSSNDSVNAENIQKLIGGLQKRKHRPGQTLELACSVYFDDFRLQMPDLYKKRTDGSDQEAIRLLRFYLKEYRRIRLKARMASFSL